VLGEDRSGAGAGDDAHRGAENHVTSARATPKNPNWASLLVTVFGIQIVAE
jgi:hypothetical protein